MLIGGLFNSRRRLEWKEEIWQQINSAAQCLPFILQQTNEALPITQQALHTYVLIFCPDAVP